MASPYTPDRPIICPYDSTHRIAQSGIQKHLVKCAKNFPPNYRVACPFNATHRLPESDLAEHVFQCPDSQYVDGSTWKREVYRNHGSIAVSNRMADDVSVECEESWDEERSTLGNETLSLSVCQFSESMIPKFMEHEPRFVEARRPINENGQEALPRPPKGRSIALMMDQTGDSGMEDIESVVSFPGMGRGKPLASTQPRLLELLGRGRGTMRISKD